MRVRRYRPSPPPTVEGVMKPGVPAIEPDEPLEQVAARMRSDHVGALTVISQGRLTGIITERDLLRAVADGSSPDRTPARTYMTADPSTIEARAEAAEAADRMIQLGVRHLPVLKNGALIGVVSARDLLQVGRRTPLELLEYEPW